MPSAKTSRPFSVGKCMAVRILGVFQYAFAGGSDTWIFAVRFVLC